ncbi:LamG domain-containing protein [Pedobacter puniceum]|uniref:LamG-like jellyroll fold domain-containing protein n=1 Tax=Pedobacter puniceum TaxID=2666136 RepID=A0A7K0FS16_9SPHI|nr:LamG domain-containing protein [Pedobacter puniceum]MRX48552.1 hypothetical protein [Pedobacter puniceum]
MKYLKLLVLLLLPYVITAQVVPISFLQKKTSSVTTLEANALDFDGINDHIITTLNADVSVMPITTWEAWVYPTKNNGDWQMIVSIEDGNWDRFIAINSGKFYVGYGSNGWNPVAADMNQWQHIAVVYNEAVGYVKFYKNGVEYNFNPGPFLHSSNVKFSIGCSQQGAPGQFYQGRIDDVRVWSIERTQAQIQANMNTELSGSEIGLVAYYTFNQGISGGNNTAITTILDKTASAFNGTLTNFAKTGATSNFVVGTVPGNLITNGLVLNLDADNTASYSGTGNTWFDLSGNNNHISWTSPAPIFTTDNGIKVIKTTPTISSLRAMVSTNYNNLPLGNGSYTSIVFFKPNSVSAAKMILSLGPGDNSCTGTQIHSGIGSGGRYSGGSCGGLGSWGANTGVVPSTSSYLCMAVSYNSTTESIYINGNLDKTANVVNAIPNSTANKVCIGWVRNDGASYNMDANIGLILFYNRALSQTEITQIFNAYKTRFLIN